MKRILIIMATVAVAAFAACDKGGGEAEVWRVAATDDGHGTAAATAGGKEVTRAGATTTITLTATPAEGYLFGMWSVTGGGVEFPNPAANPVTFTMPAGDVEVKAVFRLTCEPEMVFVEGGTFTMGSEESLADADEGPVHSVTLTKGFWIAKHEVTQAQWNAVMDYDRSRFKGDNLPVENVRYIDAEEYIKRLNAMTGKKYALPTEAQWEFAARGGNKSKGYRYSGGGTLSVVGWYQGNSNASTNAVGTASPNELGLYDMSGNVWEWTADWFALYTADAQTDPTGPATGEDRVYRGGSWSNPDRYCWPSNRGIISPNDMMGNLGMRLALIP
jgi:formylglycine-generating enzyme required for sulfatase activity